MFTRLEQFREVPNNLIALACNAVRLILSRLCVVLGYTDMLFRLSVHSRSSQCTTGRAHSRISYTLRSRCPRSYIMTLLT